MKAIFHTEIILQWKQTNFTPCGIINATKVRFRPKTSLFIVKNTVPIIAPI